MELRAGKTERRDNATSPLFSLTRFRNLLPARLHTLIAKSPRVSFAAIAALLVSPLAVAAALHSESAGNANGASEQLINAEEKVHPDANEASEKSSASQSSPSATSAETSVTVESEATSSGSSAETEVKVNGQKVPLPKSGHVQKTIPGAGGQSHVNIRVNNDSASTSSSSHSSTHIQVNSHSSSTGDDDDASEGRHPPRR